MSSAKVLQAASLVRDVRHYRDDRIFYIACDDRYAPYQYFGFFRMPRIRLVVVPAEDNLSHAKWVLDKLRRIDCEEDDERWMVLDTDHCIQPSHFGSFEQAVSEARRDGIDIAISRPSFEVWLALHYVEPDAIRDCRNADEVGAVLGNAVGGYDKTHLNESHYPLAAVTRAYERAEKMDAAVTGGDKPDANTTRVYLIWKNILSKALLSQLADELRPLAEKIRSTGV